MDRLVFWLYRAFSGGIGCLPVGVVFRLGMGLGWLGYWIALPYRRIALENLTRAFGEETPGAIRRLARRHFVTLGGNFLSSLALARLPTSWFEENIEVVHPERLTPAEDRGTILVISHMSNWEVLAQIAPILFRREGPGKKGGIIYQRLSNPFMDAALREARARQGVTLFERRDGFGKVIAMLREGGGVGVLVDQHAGDKGVWCPFFDRLASTTPLVATLALRTNAILLPAALYTVSPGRWRLVLSEPIEPAGADAATLTARINQQLEAQIREAPHDWFWVHNRWKLPRPNLLLAGYKRATVYPPGYPPERLKPLRIVVRSSNWLGDAVMTTPALMAIRAGRADLHLTVLVKAKLAPYWERVAEVDAVLRIEPGDSVFRVASKLRAGNFDAAVIFPNSIRSALEPWLAGIPRRIGYAAKGRRALLNQIVPLPGRKEPRPPHQVFHYLGIARNMGAAVPEATGPDAFFTPAPLRAAPPEKPPGQVRIGLCPGAEYGPAKRWLPERFAQAAHRFAAKRPGEFILFGVPGDAAVGAEIEARYTEAGGVGRFVNRIGKTSLSELIDELASCDCLLTNDTGTMHLAAALGVPTVAVFGSTEPVLTAPLGPGHVLLRHQVECSPCFLRECPLDFRCMRAVSAEEAVAAMETLVTR